MVSPPRIWWKPLQRMERSWLIIALVWCLFLTAMMPLWLVFGRQNVPATTYRVTPQEFQSRVMTSVEDHQVATDSGFPVVAPPPGDVYMLARQWQWFPILQLKQGESYQLHLSSMDVQHGFSLQPTNLNLMVLPGYDYVVELKPTQTGEFSVICNEFCGIGHHIMLGKIIVVE